MRLVVNIDPRRHPHLQDTIGIFIRPLAKGLGESRVTSQSDLDRLSQTGIYSLGIELGLYFNFIYADDLLSALQIAQMMGYRWAYIVNGGLLGGGLGWLNQTKSALTALTKAEFAVWRGPLTPNNCPQELLVGEISRALPLVKERKLTINGRGEFTFSSDTHFLDLQQQADVKFNMFHLDDGSSLAGTWKESERKEHSFNSVFTTGNEEPDISQFRKFLSLKIGDVIAPSSGFYVNNLLKIFGNSCSAIHYYDASPQALEYKRRVNETWSPFSTLPQIPLGAQERNDQKDLFSPKIFLTQGDVEDHWTLFKKIPKKYIQLNLMESPELLVEWVAEEGHPLIWLSNIFTYSLNLKLYSLDDIQYAFLHLIRAIKRKNPEAIVAGRLPSGRYFHDYAKDVYMGISNFNFF